MTPTLYSFRRCPYAMRARLAVASAGIKVELREIVLRDKAPEFLAASPKATVPVLINGSEIIEESLDIMHWALAQNDPEGWLNGADHALIKEADGPFKDALDRTKYSIRYEDADPETERRKAGEFLIRVSDRLRDTSYLGGSDPNLTDMAILPFVRQFANTDRTIMAKYPKWEAGDPTTYFP
jgi:glutathione S-transferase